MFPFQNNVKLHVAITWLFVLLTLPVTVFFAVFGYQADLLVVDDYSRKFIEKSIKDNVNNARRLIDPIISASRTGAALMRDRPSHFHDASSTDYLHEIVASNEAVYSANAAFADGSFRQVRRAVSAKAIPDQAPPAGTRFTDRYIDTRKKPALDAYRFHGEWGAVLGNSAVPASYDPRVRSYYKDAVQRGAVTVSDVHPFLSSGELGLSVATPVINQGRVLGVFTVDLTLETLSRYLSDNRVTANSITIMLDETAGVIAHSELERGWTHKAADVRVVGAVAERLRGGKDRFVFSAGPDNTEYIATFSPFPKDFNKPWELLIITPTDDFVGLVKSTNRDMMLLGVLAFCLQLALIYRLSKGLSKPIEQLADDVSSIREFNFAKTQQVVSRVREIAGLARAVRMLAQALESFTSYVPRGLVQQLMESGQGTRLGVESRYLTLFFTDLEGFSTLSESEPSQQLLERVSDYFSSVTNAIEREQGTVDKYIGDAVMAFWGAPKRVEGHAYLACVAAVRSQRRMAIRNRDWAAQNMAPLKVRIGIHCDAVLVGNVGSAERVSYTVMGDGVNVAARLEGINKEMGTWVCVSQAVFREAGERLWLRPIDTVTVKGRKGELLIYELLAIRDGDAEVAPTQDEMLLCDMTTQAYTSYAQEHWEQARAAYAAILERFPSDKVAQRMRDQCADRLRGR
ncbi:MAG: adenylate/guanylate cyclase domain-containing protein [Pseudomonadota bacterium]